MWDSQDSENAYNEAWMTAFRESCVQELLSSIALLCAESGLQLASAQSVQGVKFTDVYAAVRCLAAAACELRA